MAFKPKAPKSSINVPWVKEEPANAPGGPPTQLLPFNMARFRGGMGQKMAFPLPSASKGPIRARAVRRAKGIDGY